MARAKDHDVGLADRIKVLAPGGDELDDETVADYLARARTRALRRLVADHRDGRIAFEGGDARAAAGSRFTETGEGLRIEAEA